MTTKSPWEFLSKMVVVGGDGLGVWREGPRPPEGLDANSIAAGVAAPLTDVRAALAELVADYGIYTTIDDHHFMPTRDDAAHAAP